MLTPRKSTTSNALICTFMQQNTNYNISNYSQQPLTESPLSERVKLHLNLLHDKSGQFFKF